MSFSPFRIIAIWIAHIQVRAPNRAPLAASVPPLSASRVCYFFLAVFFLVELDFFTELRLCEVALAMV